MRIFVVKTINVLKEIPFIVHLVIFVTLFCAIFLEAIPDILFNLASEKPFEMTFDEIVKTPKEDLPRYIKIKPPIIPSGSYVYEKAEKSTILQIIYYPVYPEIESDSKIDSTLKTVADSSLSISLLQDFDNIQAQIVIRDNYAKVDESDDSLRHYFESLNFSAEGRYDWEPLPDDIRTLFEDGDVKLSEDVILLKKGEKGLKTSTAIWVIILSIGVGLISASSFIPTSVLVKWAGTDYRKTLHKPIKIVKQVQVSYKNTINVTTAKSLPDSFKIAPFDKRMIAFVIDYLFIVTLIVTYDIKTGNSDSYLEGIGFSLIYFTILDSSLKGSSIGKLLFRQRVINSDNHLTLKGIIIRNSIKSISNAFPVVFFYACFNPNKQALHDVVAKTFVIEKGSSVL